MVLKKNIVARNKRAKKKVIKSNKKNTKLAKSLQVRSKKKNTSKKPNILIPLIFNKTKNILALIINISSQIINFIIGIKNFIYKAFKDLLKAPFLFINIFLSTIFVIFKKSFLFGYNFLKNLFTSIFNFKEIIFGILFGVISGGIGAILAVSYLEISSDIDKRDVENTENYIKINDQINLIEKRLKIAEIDGKENKSMLEKLQNLQTEVVKSEEKYIILENNINSMNLALEKVEKETTSLESNLTLLSKDLKSNSRLILSSSKTELSNRLYLAQSLLDRLESGVPYSPQLKALGKEGLDPALLRFAAGGAPTLKDLEARLSARAGEQLDADRTKRDNTWRENLRKEISKYVKIKPTNINEIKGVTGALLRAESSISRGNLAKAIEEISAVPIDERGPLDAWLSEAKARQNADIAAKNLLAKTTAALQQKN